MKYDDHLQQWEKSQMQGLKSPVITSSKSLVLIPNPFSFLHKWSNPSTLTDHHLQIIASSWGRVSDHWNPFLSSECLRKVYNFLPSKLLSCSFIFHTSLRVSRSWGDRDKHQPHHHVWSVCCQLGFVGVGPSICIKNHSNSFRRCCSLQANVW